MEPLQNRSRQSAVRILRAAIDVITDLGIQDFTMAAVATRAEVSVGGVYGRYPDKDALLYAVKDHGLAHLADGIEASEDPLIQVRSQVYSVSYARRNA